MEIFPLFDTPSHDSAKSTFLRKGNEVYIFPEATTIATPTTNKNDTLESNRNIDAAEATMAATDMANSFIQLSSTM